MGKDLAQIQRGRAAGQGSGPRGVALWAQGLWGLPREIQAACPGADWLGGGAVLPRGIWKTLRWTVRRGLLAAKGRELGRASGPWGRGRIGPGVGDTEMGLTGLGRWEHSASQSCLTFRP